MDDAKERQGLPTGLGVASHGNAVVLAGSLSPGAQAGALPEVKIDEDERGFAAHRRGD